MVVWWHLKEIQKCSCCRLTYVGIPPKLYIIFQVPQVRKKMNFDFCNKIIRESPQVLRLRVWTSFRNILKQQGAKKKTVSRAAPDFFWHLDITSLLFKVLKTWLKDPQIKKEKDLFLLKILRCIWLKKDLIQCPGWRGCSGCSCTHRFSAGLILHLQILRKRNFYSLDFYNFHSKVTLF